MSLALMSVMSIMRTFYEITCLCIVRGLEDPVYQLKLEIAVSTYLPDSNSDRESCDSAPIRPKLS